MLLSVAWSLYETDIALRNFSPETIKGYRIQKNLLIRYLGNVNIEEITIFDLKNYLTEKGSHLKPSSLGKRVHFLKSLFKWASDEGYCISNPARKLFEPKLGKRIPKALSEVEVVLLQETCQSPMEHALMEFMYATGCRIGEIHRLNRNAINWDNRSCIVLGKGDKEREVYFTIRAMIWLKKYLNSRKDNDMALFVTERAPHRMSIAQIRYVIKRIAKQAGVNNVSPHRLRHSFATHLLNNGAPMEGIQTLLGHAKLETTMLYAQLSGPRRKEIYTRYF